MFSDATPRHRFISASGHSKVHRVGWPASLGIPGTHRQTAQTRQTNAG
jgi:hypothetical protein